ncbi:hypothetical protein FRX31_031688 [Thalictrum thalictroides]|uniref:F-box associated beta-propeller type 3 domain-containing protein n=1 Tax=Thalictrum thalictroides TaxID=46969 RepID=A0A7J6V3L0_THATH|nr:hypothetical protein FRX31_031688 [Thalictrum thalictroides]
MLIRPVIQISCSISSRHTRSQVKVCSLGTGLWRNLEELPCKICNTWKPVVLVGGSLYLFVARPGSSSYDVLVSFDLIHESFHEIPQPDGLDLSMFLQYQTPKLGELGMLFICSSSGDQVEFRIWVMEKYGAVTSWTELFRISSQLLVPHLLDNLTLLGVAKNKDLIFLRSRRTILLYNPQTTLLDENLVPSNLRDTNSHKTPESKET